MEIFESKANQVLVLAFKGRLDASTAAVAQEKLLGSIKSGETRLLADLSELTYISSAGLHVFMAAAKQLKGVHGKLAICSLSEPIKQLFEIAGLRPLFAFHASRGEALKSLNEGV